jgi:hypothetical protein
LDKKYSLQSAMVIHDLTTDPIFYQLNQTHFDFGIRLDYLQSTSFPNVQDNLDQYVNLDVT